MRKLLALILALVVVFSLAMPAMADTTFTSKEFTKHYTIINDGTTAPAETFKFLIEPEDFIPYDTGSTVEKNAFPYPANTLDGTDNQHYFSAEFANAVSATTSTDVDITFATDTEWPAAGRYIYKLTEKPSTTTGVTIGKSALTEEAPDTTSYLCVYVTHSVNQTTQADELTYEAAYLFDSFTAANDTFGDKEDGFENLYEATAGTTDQTTCNFSVKKEVSGKMGDKEHPFDIDVTFKLPSNMTIGSDITWGDNGSLLASSWGEAKTKTVTVSLKDEDTVHFKNVPVGMLVTVAEDDELATQKNYTVTYAAKEGATDLTNVTDATEYTIKSATYTQVTVMNELDTAIETGVILDSAPYVLLLAVAVLGLALVISKKRAARD